MLLRNIKMAKTRVTQKEIAQRLGVSQTLVGVALHGNGRIGAELKARIVAEAHELGYTPNAAARALRNCRSNLVALWLPQPLGVFDTQVLETLQALANRDGFHLLTALSPRISSTDEKAKNILSSLPLDAWPLDGVLALNSSPGMARAIAHLSQVRPSLTMVAFGHRTLSPNENFDYVEVSLAAAARQAVQHLVDKGCRRLAFMAAQSLFGDVEPRREAFHAICRENGLQGQEIVVPDSLTLRRASQDALSERLKNGPLFDGLFCGNDDVALGALRALSQAEIRVPDETRVIGCDDIIDSADTSPPLSTLVFPVQEMCEEVWKSFVRQLENTDGERIKTRTVLEAQLLLRQSA